MEVDFSDTLMVGRQLLYLDAPPLEQVFSVLGTDRSAEEFLRDNEYGEELFSILGAQRIDSMDYSSYEGATILHDLNSPLPGELKGRFSVVYDGGTLEHVFNVPEALKSCMEMVRVGGHFMQVNIANNFMGHGFWQFSPELLFRVFSSANGFQVESVLLHEVTPGGAWYSVRDPDEVQQRVELSNELPTYICTIAKRLEAVEVFSTPPLQSDYSAAWEKQARELARAGEPSAGTAERIEATSAWRWRDYVPSPVRRVLRGARQRLLPAKRPRGFDRPYYRRISEDDLLRGRVRQRS